MNLNELKRLALAAQEYNLEYEPFNNTLLVNHSKTLDAYYMRKDLGFFLQAMSSSTILSLISDLETCISALEFYEQEKHIFIDHQTNAFMSHDYDTNHFHGAKAREALSKIRVGE